MVRMLIYQGRPRFDGNGRAEDRQEGRPGEVCRFTIVTGPIFKKVGRSMRRVVVLYAARTCMIIAT